MPYNFQFAFLGCQHNYLARVTLISTEGFPQDDSLTETYGLPVAFATQMVNKSHRKRFFFNIRGHDFLSYCGQWKGKSRNDVGHVETAYVPISESSLLESLRRENEKKGFLGANMIPSFGPRPGNMFVDAYSLKRYKWANLPEELDDEIQRIYSVKGYDKGVIHELTMNATGGWVMLLDEGKRFSFGGELPFDLRIILQDTQKSKREMPKLDVSIYRIYLNHQNPDEYVLIFGDGQCFMSLHASFRDPMQRLLSKWASGHNNYHFNFRPSCDCSNYCQKALNAIYYSRRGLFFLSRLNVDMAMHYLREASHQDCLNLEIRENYCIAIVAMRRARGRDHTLDNLTEHRPTRARVHRPPIRRPENQDEDTFFRDEYMWMLNEQDIDVAELERRLDEIQRPFLANKWKLGAGSALSDWSYDMAVKEGDKSHELEAAERSQVIEPTTTHEMPAEVLAKRPESHVSELSSLDEINVVKSSNSTIPRRERINLNPPVWEKPKSRNPFIIFKRRKE